MSSLYEKDWVVYCKPPFGSAEHVLKYLGRYTHRVAISNQRIVKVEDGKVTFKWKDYADNDQEKLMKLDANEFIRRFLLHILPTGFVKIRYYGILSNRNRNILLKLCKKLLGVEEVQVKDQEGWRDLLLRLTGKDYSICPKCGQGHMKFDSEIKPMRNLHKYKHLVA